MSPQENIQAWKYSDAFFKDVLRQTVPEREEEIDSLLNTHGITIMANEAEDSLRFCVHLETHEITVSTSPLPRIWGYSYAYLSLYDLVAKAKIENPQASEVTIDNKQFATSMAVLKWAMKGDAEAKLGDEAEALGPQAYPAGIAQPFDPEANDPMHKAAGDLTIMALGVILLHEIAHLELGHQPSEWPDSLAEENEADAWAAAFLLDLCDEYASKHEYKHADVRRKRLLALVIGELWALHFEVHFGVKNSETHPPTYDRLSNLLDQQVEDGADLAWAMAALVLHLHYQARYGVTDADMVFDDFRDNYQHYANLLSNKSRREF